MFIEKETEHGKIRKKRTNSIRIHPHPIFRKTEKRLLEEKNRTDRSVSDIVRQAVDEYFGRKRRA